MSIARDKQLLVALFKVCSDQSTRVLGELKQQQKMRFNIAVNSIDSFINEIESKMNPTDKQDLQELTDALNDFLQDVRKQFIDYTETKSPT
jgi:polyhydroxyalkanoate synthesis regulator phasin